MCGRIVLCGFACLGWQVDFSDRWEDFRSVEPECQDDGWRDCVFVWCLWANQFFTHTPSRNRQGFSSGGTDSRWKDGCLPVTGRTAKPSIDCTTTVDRDKTSSLHDRFCHQTTKWWEFHFQCCIRNSWCSYLRSQFWTTLDAMHISYQITVQNV